MPHQATKKRANLSIDSLLLEEAKAMNINISKAAEEGVKHAVSEARKKSWQDEHQDQFEKYNQWVKENGLPLSKHRKF